MPTYPLTLPASPAPREVTWRPVSRVAVSASPFTGDEQVHAHAGQWWELAFELPPLNQAQAAAWRGVLLALNGREGTFLFAPTDATPQAAVSGTVTVSAVSGYQVTVTGITGTFTAGDWLQIENGLYTVTSVSSGTVFEVWPKPRAEISTGVSTIDYASPQGRFRIMDGIEWEMDVAKRYGISLAAKEAL